MISGAMRDSCNTVRVVMLFTVMRMSGIRLDFCHVMMMIDFAQRSDGCLLSLIVTYLVKLHKRTGMSLVIIIFFFSLVFPFYPL